MSSPPAYQFPGFRSPTYTIVPDELFDELLSLLSGAELKVLLYIIRRTFGFKKSSDDISLTQICRGIVTKDGRVLDQGTGLHRETAVLALKGLIEKNVITAIHNNSTEKGHEATTYGLAFMPPWSENPTRGSRKFRPGLVGNSDSQETVLQETVEQETDLSNIRMVPTRKNVDNSGVDRRHTHAPATIPFEARSLTSKQISNAVLKSFAAPAPNSVTHSAYGPERQLIVDYIVDFAREFNDEAPAKSSVTRAVNLFRRSGLELETFCEHLLAARAVVKERTAAIKTTTEPGKPFPTKRKMGYFFAVLEDQLGLREDQSIGGVGG